MTSNGPVPMEVGAMKGSDRNGDKGKKDYGIGKYMARSLESSARRVSTARAMSTAKVTRMTRTEGRHRQKQRQGTKRG